MPKTIAGKKRKGSEINGARSRPSASASSSENRQTRSLKVYSDLCIRCARLDLDKMVLKKHKPNKGGRVATLSPFSTWSIDSCSFCTLMSSILPISFKETNGKPVELSSWSTHTNSDWGWKLIDKTLLQIANTDEYIVAQEVGANSPIRILEQSSIDFDILKGWIRMCQNLHTKACAVKDPSSVPFLKLVDCETRKIILAENHPYVALSYVWGQTSSPSNSECLPENLPSTIEDSITVTRRLGFRYLWVDRYCINQERQQEVIQQVQKMDLIYQNAQITIIACAGEDPTYGLPGIGYRKRRLQPHATVGKHLMVSVLSDPRRFIENSKWSSRAWTFQEALLSRRRLVFTDEQVYYECHGMYCCEAMNFPLLDLHTKDRQGFKRAFCQGDGIGLFPKGVGRSSWGVVQRIEEYSGLSLNLREPSDILKGILGILSAFERSTLKIHHYAGIPLLPSCPEIIEHPNDNWSSAKGFFSGLCWTSTKPSSRRAGFPSWSWTGWLSPVKWGYQDFKWPDIRVDNKVQVGVELVNGRILDWEIFNQLKDTPELTCGLTNFIHISAWTSTLRIRQRSQLDPDKYTAKIKLESGGYINWCFKSTSNIPLQRNQIATGIHLVHQSGFDLGSSIGPALMVVSQVGNVTERIGFGWVDQFYYHEFDKNGDAVERECIIANSMYFPPLRLVKSWQTIQLG